MLMVYFHDNRICPREELNTMKYTMSRIKMNKLKMLCIYIRDAMICHVIMLHMVGALQEVPSNEEQTQKDPVPRNEINKQQDPTHKHGRRRNQNQFLVSRYFFSGLSSAEASPG